MTNCLHWISYKSYWGVMANVRLSFFHHAVSLQEQNEQFHQNKKCFISRQRCVSCGILMHKLSTKWLIIPSMVTTYHSSTTSTNYRLCTLNITKFKFTYRISTQVTRTGWSWTTTVRSMLSSWVACLRASWRISSI